MKRALLNAIEKCAEKADVEVCEIHDSSKHIKVFVKGNKLGLVFVSKTASDYRAFKNVVTDMRRMGYSK